MKEVLIKFLDVAKEYKFPVLLLIVAFFIVLFMTIDKVKLLLLLIGFGLLATGLFASSIDERIDKLGRFSAIILGFTFVTFALIGERFIEPHQPSETSKPITKEPPASISPASISIEPPPPLMAKQQPPTLRECVEILNDGAESLSATPYTPSSADNEDKCSNSTSLLAPSPSLSILPSTSTNWSNSIGLATAHYGSTYYEFGCNIKKIVKDSTGLNIIVKDTNGSADNLEKVAGPDKGYSFGLIQGDFIRWAERQDDWVDSANKIKELAYLYDQEIHIFADKSIDNINVLGDKKISYGQTQFGGYYSAWNILNVITKIKKDNDPLIFKGETPAEGICKVLLGEVDAMFYTGGAPVSYFSKLTNLFDKYPALRDKAHLVELTKADTHNSSDYKPSLITKNEYQWLDRQQINTLSTKAILFTYDFKAEGNQYQKDRCVQLNAIAKTIQQWLVNRDGHFNEEFHKKWSEVAKEGEWGAACK